MERIRERMDNECNISYYVLLMFFPQGHLSDNKWHTVIIGRPTRYSHTLMVDGHIATATTRGDNYHLDLDGILYLGNLSSSMSPFHFYQESHIPLISLVFSLNSCRASDAQKDELLF